MGFLTLLGAGYQPVAGGGGGGITFLVGTSAASGTSGNGVTTGAIDTTGADLLVVLVSDYSGGSTRTVSDSKANSWTPQSGDANGGAARARLYWCKPSSVGSGHTFTDLSTSNYATIVVGAFSGTHATPFDVESTGTGTNVDPATASAGSITPSLPNGLVIAGVAVDTSSATAIDSSFIVVDTIVPQSSGNNQSGGMAYKIQTTAVPVNPTWTLTAPNAWAATIASFKAA